MKKSKKLDVCISFDTTGSMYPCLYEVRRNLASLVEKIFSEGNDVRIAVIAHGDYCDADSTYVLKKMDFTTNERKLAEFINSVGQTYGGDAPECYEYALKTANEMEWRKDSTKLLILVGDATPHGSEYYLNTAGTDWKRETYKLSEKGVKVYPVHAMPGIRSYSKPFYTNLACLTGGAYLQLDQFAALTELIVATIYAQDENIDIEDMKQFATSYAMAKNVNSLLGKAFETSVPTTFRSLGLVPVPEGSYQVFPIPTDMPIKQFVEESGAVFTKGNGFYELTKTETVQQYKEIFLQDRATGRLFTGPQVREMLGLLPKAEGTRGGASERIKPVFFEEYRVFIQSTSYNRKLKAGTMFLYKVEEHLDLKETVFVVEETVVSSKAVKSAKSKGEPAMAKSKATKSKKADATPVKETKKKVKLANGKTRVANEGDLVILRSNKNTRTLTYVDGALAVSFKGKVTPFKAELFSAIFTPKMKEDGTPETKFSTYTDEEKVAAKYAELL